MHLIYGDFLTSSMFPSLHALSDT